MNPPEVHAIAAAARASRATLLATHSARQFELPLRFWRQQVHFTTPANGRPEKALSALAGVPRLLARFDLSVDAVAAHLGVDATPLQAVLNADDGLPAVLLDAEDAVAATAEAARQARAAPSRVSGMPISAARCACFARPGWHWTAASTT